MTSRSTARSQWAAPGQQNMPLQLVLRGEFVVGKASLILHFVKGQFHKYQESTIGNICNSQIFFFFFAF
uniref:Uncharacterized protein n=1 Tax=Sus scrofa TaxID=9823 RepID=A0A8D0MGY1_PIG